MASRRSRTLAALAAAALSCAATGAQANPTAQQKDLARGLMQRGREARDANDLDLALESFKAADEIMHVTTTGFEMARSQADVGHLVEAHETLERVMRIPERPDDSQTFRDARVYSKVFDDDLLLRIPRLRITVSGAPAEKVTSISVDGVALPPAAMLVPYRVDPGHHVIILKTDTGEGRVEVDEKERDVTTVAIVVAAPSVVTPAPAAANPMPSEPTPAPRATLGKRGLGTVTWIGLGLAGVGVVAGSVTGALSLSDKGTLASQCNGTRCPPSANGTLQAGNAFAAASTVTFVAAGVGVALAAAGFFLLRPAPKASATGIRIVPWIGLASGGLNATF